MSVKMEPVAMANRDTYVKILLANTPHFMPSTSKTSFKYRQALF
jgi:hypothetical protein